MAEWPLGESCNLDLQLFLIIRRGARLDIIRVVARAAQVVALRPDPLCWCNSLIRPSKGMNAAEVYEIASSHLQSGIDDTSAGLWIDAIS